MDLTLSFFFQRLLEKFSVRFCQCNPRLGLSVGKENYEALIKVDDRFYIIFLHLQMAAGKLCMIKTRPPFCFRQGLRHLLFADTFVC